jgi:hypothetical protein
MIRKTLVASGLATLAVTGFTAMPANAASSAMFATYTCQYVQEVGQKRIGWNCTAWLGAETQGSLPDGMFLIREEKDSGRGSNVDLCIGGEADLPRTVTGYWCRPASTGDNSSKHNSRDNSQIRWSLSFD